jgi:general secretion pathway protein C
MLKRALSLINIALVIVLAFAALMLARDAVSFIFTKPRETSTVRETRASRQAPKTLQDYSLIMKNNIFGLRGELLPLSGGGRESYGTDIILVGTVKGPAGFGYAIFKMDGRQEVYKTGQTVPGAGKLSKVEKEKIFFDTGRELALAEIAVIREIKRPPSAQGFARQTSEGTFMLDQSAVEKSLSNPQQILGDARLLPNIIEGKQEGYVIREIRPGGIYQSLGLKSGDVLLRINEYNISNPEAALQAFTALRGLDRVELDIVRGGSRMTLTYQIR